MLAGLPGMVSFGASEVSLQLRNELVAQSLNAAFESSVVLRIPLGAGLAGYSVCARERNVEHVVLIMARISIDGSTVASCCKRNRGLADKWLSIVAVGISPHAVNL